MITHGEPPIEEVAPPAPREGVAPGPRCMIHLSRPKHRQVLRSTGPELLSPVPTRLKSRRVFNYRSSMRLLGARKRCAKVDSGVLLDGQLNDH